MDLFDPNTITKLTELSDRLTDGLFNRNYEDSLRAGEALFEMMPDYMSFHMVLLSLFRLDYSDRMLPQIKLNRWEDTLVQITAGMLVDIGDLFNSPTTTKEQRCQLCYYMGCRMVYVGQGELANQVFSVCAITDADCLEKNLAMDECETRGITVNDDVSGRFFHGSTERQAALKRHDAVGSLIRKGQWALALPLAQEALTLARQTLGENNIVTSASYNGVGTALHGLGRLREALPHFEAAHQIQRRVLGVRNPDVIKSLDHLAQVHRDLGNSAAASRCLEEILKIRRLWKA
jgi:hypothetical protein